MLMPTAVICAIPSGGISVDEAHPGLKRLIEEERHAALYRTQTIIRSNKDGKVLEPASVPTQDEVAALLKKFNTNGSYKADLPLTNIMPKVLKLKRLPKPKTKEVIKYIDHAYFLDELYELARASQLNANFKGDQELVDFIFNSLSWYMTERAPERPYWRLTMRFGGLNRDKKLGTSIMFYLDRILLTMAPEINAAKRNGNVSRITLCRNVTDYTDNLIELAVGAQNRGVNWQGRHTQLTCHYTVKYLCGDKGAWNQLKHHFYDGFEYDPERIISGGMGILSDGGFWHHGPQPYCMPYALNDYYGAMALMKRLEGTPIKFLPKHYQNYEKQMLDKWQYVIFNDQWFDLSIVGGKNACQIRNSKARVNPGTLEHMLDQMLKLDSSNFSRFAELKALKKALVRRTHHEEVSVNRNFWHWEYMLHRRNGWYIGFKGMSNRTMSCEWDQNFHLTSGHTAIMREGDEYWKIRPALNWAALPGTTAEQVPYNLLIGNDKTMGRSSFANGVSDGKQGLFAFEMQPDNLGAGAIQANKSGFFLSRGMVALTSGIHRTALGSGDEVWTTLDQRKRNGTVWAMVNGKELVLAEKIFEKNLMLTRNAWFFHNGIGYIVPVKKGESVFVKLSSQTRSGRIADVLPHNKSKDKYKENVFLLAINHGVVVNGEVAAYYVLPDATRGELNVFLTDPPYEIISNTEKCQTVVDRASGIAQCVFYKSTSVNLPGMFDVTAIEPCLAMFKMNGDKLTISLANPLHRTGQRKKNTNGVLQLNRKLNGEFSKYINEEGFSKIVIPYPSVQGYEGSTVSAKFKFSESQ